MAVSARELQGLYLAYFGRPADNQGLAFYTASDAVGLWQIASFFSASAESQSLFFGSTTSDVIDSIYMNLFNRHAEADGLQFWANAVDSGQITAGQAAYSILSGAQNADSTTIANKIATCEAFTATLAQRGADGAYIGDAAAARARELVHAVDDSALSASVAGTLLANTIGAMANDLSRAAENTVQVELPAASDSALRESAHAPNALFGNGAQEGQTPSLLDAQPGGSMEIAGAMARGAFRVQMASDSSSDYFGIRLNPYFADDNDTTSEVQGLHHTGVDIQGVEHLHVTSTGYYSPVMAQPVEGWQADGVANLLELTDDALETLVVDGTQALIVMSVNPLLSNKYSDFSHLKVVDASHLRAVPMASPSGGVAAFQFESPATSSVETIIGSATSTNVIYGSGGSNTIVGGAQADRLIGQGGADTLTGGGGNDKFQYLLASDSLTHLPTDIDTITDFHANTVGTGVAGAVDAGGAADAAARDGDVLDFSAFYDPAASTALHDSITVEVAANADDAMQRIAVVGHTAMKAVLDASDGTLYVDVNSDGKADMEIDLVGVKTLTEAAFLLHQEN